jgi:hypothetical protein
MFGYIRKYPVSLSIIIAVIYLSFFKPPSVNIGVSNLDKFAHFCMYAGLSGILWIEFLRNHRNNGYTALWRAWVGAALCPILFGGIIEVLQEYMTSHRGGDWLDFFANTGGVIFASMFSYFVVRPRFLNT